MISAAEIAKSLTSLVEDEGKDAKSVVKDFFAFMKANNLSGLIPSVLKQLEKQRSAKKDESAIQVRSAQKLSGESEEKIRKMLGVGKNVAIEAQADASVLGGFVARFQGIEYEGSFERSVNFLEKSLIE